MSSNVSYIPSSDADKVIWFSNFSSKIGTYATAVGVTAAEVTTVQKDYAMFSYMMNMLEAYKQTVNNITSYKNLLKHAVGNNTWVQSQFCLP